MKFMHVCMFIVCFNFAFLIITPMGLFGGGVGPSGVGTTDLNITGMIGVAVIVGALALGGVVIAGWTFKTSSVLTAFLGIYVASSALMLTIFAQLMAAIGVGIPSTAVMTGVITALYGFVGVEGAMQIAGTPYGIMD
jgi:hypothetical protein